MPTAAEIMLLQANANKQLLNINTIARAQLEIASFLLQYHLERMQKQDTN